MATVLITGGTGLVGSALARHLQQKQHEVIILSRSRRVSDTPGLRYAVWDVDNQTIEADAIKEADYIIHLAGAGVADKRWSESRKQEILQSRTRSSALIVKALKDNPHKVKAVVSASAIGWYGPDKKGGEPFKESSPAYNDYLGSTSLAWEDSISGVKELGVRLVKLRTGIVLSKEGGALAEFMKPLKFGFATIMGTGKQVVSWIHISDLTRMYEYAMTNEDLHGVYNAVAPQPVTNKDLVVQLAKRMRGNMYTTINAPAFALKIALGEMSIEVLKSATVSAEKISKAGFKFYFPSIQSALDDLVNKRG